MDVIQHIGDELTSGLYVLHIQITEPVELAIGVLNKGKNISFDRGNYCYVGSAKGKKGSSTLVSRLLRHCRRTPNRRRHAIYEALRAFFRKKGVVFTLSNQSKTKYWHIDYLVNDETVQINRILIVGYPEIDEQELVELMCGIDHFQMACTQFGASDSPHSSHLFKIINSNGWNQLISGINESITPS